jgi:hypothetical protein
LAADSKPVGARIGSFHLNDQPPAVWEQDLVPARDGRREELGQPPSSGTLDSRAQRRQRSPGDDTGHSRLVSQDLNLGQAQPGKTRRRTLAVGDSQVSRSDDFIRGQDHGDSGIQI